MFGQPFFEKWLATRWLMSGQMKAAKTYSLR
jgi:hypothetical protein